MAMDPYQVIDIKNHDYRQTFLLRNKIRNSEPRFDRKAKELQPQLGVKVPYKKTCIGLSG